MAWITSADIGVTSLVSTRVATIQRANRAGMVTMQKVFVTDRSTWPRSVKALEQSDPNLVQLMPAPMLSHLPEADRKALAAHRHVRLCLQRGRHPQRARAWRGGGLDQRPQLWNLGRKKLKS